MRATRLPRPPSRHRPPPPPARPDPPEGPCTVDPDLWHPEGSKLERLFLERQARETCLADCEVRDACLAYALSFPEQPDGIWAGLNRRERERLAEKAGAA